MKSNNNLLFYLVLLLLAACGGSGGGTTSSAPSSVGTGGSTPSANVLAITVNDPTYPNKPTVSVTVCTPGTSNCQTINNILLDTGSYGLRIFKQTLLTVSLPQVIVGSSPLAECIGYMDGIGDWGPVQTADVVLGGETAANIPIQVIDATYFANAIPTTCKPPNVISLDQSPNTAGFNGILGVGLFASDCGPGCTSSANNGVYYVCNGSTCTGTRVPLTSQVQNPVAHLNQDNNGIIVQMPSVTPGGLQSVNGQLILGIGTQANNTPSGVRVFPADNNGEFTTIFNGSTLTNSFIDSGSNGLFFGAPASLLAICASPNQDWYCPQSTQSLSAINSGDTGSPSILASFQIGNANNLFSSVSKSAFSELGGTAPAGSGFDWGLPFFFGRSIYVGLEGTGSSLGSGPFWAY